jgi:hypothetical protein
MLLLFVSLPVSGYEANKSADPGATCTAHEPSWELKNPPSKQLVSSVFIDKAVLDLSINQGQLTEGVYHLFSHGRPGELFLDDQWRNAHQIVEWVRDNDILQDKSDLNIYGCEFAKGEKGKEAVSFLETALGISIAASDDLTGKDGFSRLRA